MNVSSKPIDVASRRGSGASAAPTVLPLMHACVVACPRPQAEAVRREALLAAATHDLKSPLASMTLWIDVLLKLQPRLRVCGDAQAVVLLDQALEQMQMLLQRSLNLIEHALDVSRLGVDSPLPFAPAEVDLVALVREVLQGRPADGEHRVRFDSAQSELWGWWDAGRLARLFDNLLTNATKYSPRGQTVTLRVTADHSGEQPWAAVEVEDNGIGIPAADLPYLFEPFHRAPNAEPTTAGTGLGLWGCRTIVEQHGGTLAVASREGEGTTVTVRLPLGRTAVQARTPGYR